MTLSAETKTEIPVGGIELVAFRLELTSEAVPLAVSQPARAKPDVPIVVSLSVENDALEIVGDTKFELAPPAPQKPQNGFFRMKGVRAGAVRLAVAFRQGGSDLGVIGLAVAVVDGTERPYRRKARPWPRRGISTDDDMLTLLIEQRLEGGQVFYDYILHSEALGLPYRRLRSKPLLDRGGGPAATPQAVVERIYERVTQELEEPGRPEGVAARSTGPWRHAVPGVVRPGGGQGAVAAAQPHQARADRVVGALYPLGTGAPAGSGLGDIDDRFLAEYSLVRTLADDMPPTRPLHGQVGLFRSHFPERAVIRRLALNWTISPATSPESLQGHGITPSALVATRDAFYDASGGGRL